MSFVKFFPKNQVLIDGVKEEVGRIRTAFDGNWWIRRHFKRPSQTVLGVKKRDRG
jgi:hypothetical protein